MNNDNFIGNVIDSKITYQGRRGRQDCQDHVLANILKKKTRGGGSRCAQWMW